MATKLRHDAQGFLIGEIIDGNRELLRSQQASMSLWKGIRSDVSAIARAIGVQTQAAARMRQPGQVNATPVRTAGGNYTGGPASPAGRAPASVASPAGRRAAAAYGGARATATVQSAATRDAKGRFAVGADKSASPDKTADLGGGSVGGAVNRLTNAVGRMAASLHATDNLDPSINAAKEVTDVVAPLGRGLAPMFGRNSERKKERWYNSIWKALTAKREDKVVVAGGGGLFGGLGGKGGMPGGGGLLGGLLGKGKGLLKGGGRLLRRVPLLGALLAGGGAIASMLGMDDDDSKTPEENRAQRYRGTGEAVGMGVGGVLGGVLGSLLGPAGTVAGALVGSIVGEKVGGAVGTWTKTLVDVDIGGKVIEGWNVVTAGVSAAWESLTTDLKASWDGITARAGEWLDSAKAGLDSIGKTMSDAGNAVNDWIKAKTGVDVKGSVGKAAGRVGEVAGAAWDKTKDVAGAGWSAAEDYAAQAGSAAIEGAKAAAAAATPNTLKRAYSAGAAAATQAKAGYDERRGTETTTGAPLNALQSAARSAGSAAGGLGNMIAKHEGGYGSFNRGNAGDSGGKTIDFSQMTVAEIMAAQSLKKGDASRLFAVGKYQVIPSTMQGAAKAMGLKGDEKFTPELQERILAEYLTDKKRPQIAGYIKGEHDNLTSAQLAGAREWASIADPKTGQSFYAGSGNNRAGMSADNFGAGLNAARANYKALIARGVDPGVAYSTALRGSSLPPVSSPSVPTGVSANVPPSVPPNIPPLPTDSVPAAMNSGAGAGRGTVGVTIRNEVSQNVPDRGVAHVQTGGLGG